MEISLVFPHQLFEKHPALDVSRPVYLFEDGLVFGGDKHWGLNFHRQKVVLHRASLKAYEKQLKEEGYEVKYLAWKKGTTLADHLPVKVKVIHFCDPVDDVTTRRLDRLGVQLQEYPTPNFLSPRGWLDEVLGTKKKPFMANFYKLQRKRLDLLMEEGGEPTGGKWSFDEDNRKKLPKNQPVPEPPADVSNDFVKEAQDYVEKKFPDAFGCAHGFAYPVDRAGAKRWLKGFLKERFHLFGDYEDAISTKHRIMFHSVITPSLNIGLLNPDEVIKEAVKYAQKHKISLNTVEGFVRQIIGWREFMRAMYLHHGVCERNGNFWGFTREMPSAFYDGTTGIDPIDETIHRVLEDGYCHHIERLMLLGNFMLLCRIHPTAVYRWFMELFIDAYDWVMVPNVYGMSQFADGGIFTTKPYLSGSNYVRKMSDYKKGQWCAVWDGLFWTFIADHHEVFLKNHRMARMAHMWTRMEEEKQQTHRENADGFLAKFWS